MSPVRPVLSARHYALLTAAFTLFVLYGSFVPLRLRSVSFAAGIEKFTAKMSEGVSLESRSDWAANVLLFVPLGFLAAGAVAVDRRRPIAVLALIPAMTALSAAIEFCQIWFEERSTAVNDVAAETLGGMIGIGVWFAFGQLATTRFRSAWANLGPGDWAAKALPAYFVFLVFAQCMPFDLTLSPWGIYHKYTSGHEIDAPPDGSFIRWIPHWSVIGEKTLMHIVFFLPVGALLARLPGYRWRVPSASGRVFLIGLGVAGTIEFMQLFVMSAGNYASDIVLGALFVLAGWKLSIGTNPRWYKPAALATWCMALAFVSWLPFDFEPAKFAGRLDRVGWLPFADYYAGDYIRAFNRILNKTVLFVPAGFLVARSRSKLWPAIALGTLLSTVIEFGQALLTEHPASTSDAILGAVGAGIGGLIASRLPGDTVAASSSKDRRFLYD